jgi:hypothetical protein
VDSNPRSLSLDSRGGEGAELDQGGRERHRPFSRGDQRFESHFLQRRVRLSRGRALGGVELGEAMREIGGDGFLVTENLTRRTISEIADGLAPALKRRNLIRSSYSRKHFRDNLLAF